MLLIHVRDSMSNDIHDDIKFFRVEGGLKKSRISRQANFKATSFPFDLMLKR